MDVVAEVLSGIGNLRVHVFRRYEGGEASAEGDTGAGLPSVDAEVDPTDQQRVVSLRFAAGPASGSDVEVVECKLNPDLSVQHSYTSRRIDFVEFKGRVRSKPSLDGIQVERGERIVDEEGCVKNVISNHGRCTLVCPGCSTAVLNFDRVASLPHSGWIESAANWFCSCSGTENSLHYLEQVEDNIQPEVGKCLLGETVCIATCEQVGLDGRDEKASDQHIAYCCAGCSNILGVIGPWPSTHGTGTNSAVTIFKHLISVKEKEDLFSKYNPANSFGNDLLLLSTAKSQMHFQVRFQKLSLELVGILQLVVLNQSVLVDHLRIGSDGDSKEEEKIGWQRVTGGGKMKVLFKFSALTDDNMERLSDDWAERVAADQMTMFWDKIGEDIISALEESKKLVPESCRAFNGFQVGYIALLESSEAASRLIFE